MRVWLRHQDRAWLLLVVLAIIALHVFAFGNTQIADDTWFARQLDTQSLSDFLAFRYTHWSGRLPIEATLVLLIGHPWLWKLLNGAMWLLLCYSAGRVSLARTGVSAAGSTALVFVLFMLISPAIVFNAAWWMTGSVNYLWPMALGLYGLLAFVDTKGHGHNARLGFLLASGLAMYNEQVALVLLPISLWLLGWRVIRRRWRGWDLAQVGFMAINALVVFGAPGSYHRFLSEEALRFPNFSALGVLDKAAIGFGLIFQSTLDSNNWMIAALIVFSAALVWRSPVGRLNKAAMLSMLAYLALDYVLAIPGLSTSRIHDKLYVLPTLGGAAASSSRAYALSAWSAFAVAALVGAASIAFWRSHRECLIALITMLFGLASLAVIGFSPTAYASGWRVHFVCQIAFLLVAARMTAEVRQVFGPRIANVAIAVMAVAAAYRVLQLLR